MLQSAIRTKPQRRYMWMVVLAVLILTSSAFAQVIPPGSSPGATSGNSSIPVSLYWTTQDQTNTNLPGTFYDNIGTPVLTAFSSGTGTHNDAIKIYDSWGNQQMVGFGANFSDLTAYLVQNLAQSDQSDFMHKVFDPATGAGLNMILTTIGADDQVPLAMGLDGITHHDCANNPADTDTRCGYQGTYDDSPNPGSTDWPLQYFSIGSPASGGNAATGDFVQRIPQILAAFKVNPAIHVVASAYWMPNWAMVQEGSSVTCGVDPPGISTPIMAFKPGTDSNGVPYYGTAAEYFRKFVAAYNGIQVNASGVPVPPGTNGAVAAPIKIWALTPQNEPCQPGGQQTGELNPDSAAALLDKKLLPVGSSNPTTTLAGALAAYNTQILPEVDSWVAPAGYYPHYAGSGGSQDLTTDYTHRLYFNSGHPNVPNNIMGVAWHGYGTAIHAPKTLDDNFITSGLSGSATYHVDQYMTEYDRALTAGSNNSPDIQPTEFANHALQPLVGLNYLLKSWMWHGIANDPGDDLGTCNTTCMPLMNIDITPGASQPLQLLQPFYILRHFSKSIQQGAYILGTSIYPTQTNPVNPLGASQGGNGNVYAVAARNPDGSHALVVLNYNPGTGTTPVDINWGGQTTTYQVPNFSLSTFTWSGYEGATYTQVDDNAQGGGTNYWTYSGSGWTHSSCTGCYGSTISSDSNSADSVVLRFTGLYANVFGSVGPGGGSATFTLDAEAPVTVSETAATAANNVLIYSSQQQDQNTVHTLTIRKTDTSTFKLDRAEVVMPNTISLDDSAFTYGGTWTPCGPCAGDTVGLYNQSSHRSVGSGNTATLNFTGSGVNLYVVRGTSKGYANVSIDGSPAVRIDTFAAKTAGNQIAWVSPPLASGNHTLVVTSLGTHNGLSDDSQIIIDRAEIVH